MKKFLKVIACLYASMVTAIALADSVTFNGGKTVQGYEFLKFDVYTSTGQTTLANVAILAKLTIDENELNKVLKQGQGENFKEITLIIPGKTQGKQVYIGKEAFQGIDSNRLRLNIQFQNNVPNSSDKEWVQLPSDCSHLFSSSHSIIGRS